jgi:hypothetical protein
MHGSDAASIERDMDRLAKHVEAYAKTSGPRPGAPRLDRHGPAGTCDLEAMRSQQQPDSIGREAYERAATVGPPPKAQGNLHVS